MSSPSEVRNIIIPVSAGKVGVYYDAVSKVISHYATYRQDGKIVSSMPVILADNEEELQQKIAAAKLIQRK